jgi:hypothetical protein
MERRFELRLEELWEDAAAEAGYRAFASMVPGRTASPGLSLRTPQTNQTSRNDPSPTVTTVGTRPLTPDGQRKPVFPGEDARCAELSSTGSILPAAVP